MKVHSLFSTKKGVSPLIATVLLIAFAVALGAVVMQWGKNYVDKTQESVEENSNFAMMCQQTTITILEVGGTPKICYTKKENSTELTSIIENSGGIEVKGIIVKAISGNDEVSTNEVTQTIPVSDAKKIILSYPSEFGEIKQVEYTPKIKKEGTNMNDPCVRQKMVIEDVYPC